MTRLIGSMLTAMVLVLCGAVQAWAHAYVQSASPSDGSEFNEPPQEIRITYTEGLVTNFSTLKLLDARGEPVASTQQTAEGDQTLVLRVPPLPNGVYTVQWQVLSKDTHVTDGVLTFAVGVALPKNKPADPLVIGGPDPAPAKPDPQPATEQPATEPPATEQPATEQPAAEKPATEQPATEQPAAEKPATEQPATEQPAAEKPATEQPATQPATPSTAQQGAGQSAQAPSTQPASSAQTSQTGSPPVTSAGAQAVDSGSLWLWGGLGLLIAAGAGGALLLSRRRARPR